MTSPEAKFLFPFLGLLGAFGGFKLWTGTWPRACQFKKSPMRFGVHKDIQNDHEMEHQDFEKDFRGKLKGKFGRQFCIVNLINQVSFCCIAMMERDHRPQITLQDTLSRKGK